MQTTKVPQFIYEDAVKRGENINVLISQPRKIAAVTIARRVAAELKCSVGELVGYQIGLDKKMNKMDSGAKTSLLYCTAGVILQKLLKKKSMEGYTHIILDEIHERDIDTDLLMTIMRQFLHENPNDTRIILMSATLNSEKFVSYFTLSYGLPKEIAPPVISMQINRPFEIEIYYLDHVEATILQSVKNKDIIDYSLISPSISYEMYQIAAQLLLLTLKEQSSDSILVFLPGINEIESMHSFLRSYADIDELCLISVLHSQLPASEQNEVFRRATLPRVILSTNIAESSVTIPKIATVIDFCLVKNIVVEKDSSMANLKLEWASKHNCAQRAGRTGRVCNGRVFRMIHERFFQRHIKKEPIPEMTRAPLETTILHVKKIFSDNPALLINQSIDPPKDSSIIHSILTLKELGGLTIFNSNGCFFQNDGDMTYIGEIMSILPLDPRLSKLIVMGQLFGVPDDTIILAAALNVKSIFPTRYDKKMDDFLMKLKWALGSQCDALTMLNAYKFWLYSSEEGKLRDWKVEVEWCKQQNLERKSLHEMRNLINEIRHRLTDFKVECANFNWKKHEVPFILKICMAASFYPNFFMLGSNEGESNEKEVYRGLLGLDPNRTIYFVNFKQEYIGELYSERIKEKIVKCGIASSTKDMKVIFDSSKVFIQFPESTSCVDDENYEEHKVDLVLPGKLQLEIYKAVKFRKISLQKEQQNRPPSTLKLKVLPIHEAKLHAIEEGL